MQQGKIIIYQMMTRLFGNTNTTNKQYGTIDENGVGKFNDITDRALLAIKELGITHVWYTGVIEHATLTDYTRYNIPLDDADVVKGRAGSPYAIKDYYDVNPDLAVDVHNRMKEFEQLIKRTHKAGLKAIIDFVPNHVARKYISDSKPVGVKDLGEGDNTSVAFYATNNFYYLPGESFQAPKEYNSLGEYSHPTKDGKFEEMPAKGTGNDHFTSSPGVHDWFETIKLNYGVDIQHGRKTYFDPVPDTWLKMHDILIFWAAKNVDGFRCDMAEMVPVEFWNWVIPKVKQVNPEILFIGEIYNPDEYRNYITVGQFDFLYDKVLLYDTLRSLINGKGNALEITHLQKRLAGIEDKMLHFMENHDEQRIASSFFAEDSWKAVSAMVISATVDRGAVMIYFGQEVGEPAKGSAGFQANDGRTTIFDYWGVPEHQKWMNGSLFDGGLLSNDQKKLRKFYSDLLTLVCAHPAIVYGDYIDVTDYNRSTEGFSDKIHVFIRYYKNHIIVVIGSFESYDVNINIKVPFDVLSSMALHDGKSYTAKDLLHEDVHLKLTDGLLAGFHIKAFGAAVLQIETDVS